MKRKYTRKKPRLSPYERIMRNITTGEDIKHDCWVWNGGVNNAGYGLIRDHDQSKMVTVHRAMGIHVGLDTDKEIQHTCLNKLCVNPRHLVNGDNNSRKKRIIKKHGNTWMQPKEKYYTCKHCGESTYFSWFNRKHSECYPGMNQNIKQLLNKKHK